jgi:hypothetical protein
MRRWKSDRNFFRELLYGMDIFVTLLTCGTDFSLEERGARITVQISLSLDRFQLKRYKESSTLFVFRQDHSPNVN